MTQINPYRQSVRIRNTEDRPLTAWLEPQAEQFELSPGEAIDFVFIGDNEGVPEIIPSDQGTAVYGWDGADSIAIKEGMIATSQPTIAQIVERVLNHAKTSLKTRPASGLAEVLEIAQGKLDYLYPTLDRESQEVACDIAGYLVDELASCLSSSRNAADAIWKIASRLVALRGVSLVGDPPLQELSDALGKAPSSLGSLLQSRAYSFLPGRFKLFSDDDVEAAKLASPTTRR